MNNSDVLLGLFSTMEALSLGDLPHRRFLHGFLDKYTQTRTHIRTRVYANIYAIYTSYAFGMVHLYTRK